LIGFAINVGIASLVVNVIKSQFGVSEELWATIGAVIGSIIGLAWNYLGYKLIVFKEKDEQQPSNLS
jgi:putative flippase GtrA